MVNLSNYTAMILGAGLGERLRPLTNTTPKVMVPLADGRPLLEHQIRHLSSQGVKDFVINLYYLPETIRQHFGNGENLGVNIRYSDESGRILGTGGAMKKAGNLLSDPFIYMYGDQVHFFDFRQVVEFYERQQPLAVVVLKRSDLPQNGDLAEIDPTTSRIIRWHPRPHAITSFGRRYFLNSGLYVFSKQVLRYIPPKVPINLDEVVLPKLIREGVPVYAVITDEPILDIGTPEKYQIAKDWHRAETDKRQKKR